MPRTRIARRPARRRPDPPLEHPEDPPSRDPNSSRGTAGAVKGPEDDEEGQDQGNIGGAGETSAGWHRRGQAGEGRASRAGGRSDVTSGRPGATSGRRRGGSARRARPRRPAPSTTATMRERFLAGEDVSDGVRPEVLLSWYRCRDDYDVDPYQERAPSARERGTEPAVSRRRSWCRSWPGVAKSIEADVEALGALVAVTDGRGGILAAWGDRYTLQQAENANLTARFAWSEQGAGTNGMGTALMSEGPIIIRGPEHWCAGFHDWDCAGVAVRDPVGRDAARGARRLVPEGAAAELGADLVAEGAADDRVRPARPRRAHPARPRRHLLGRGAGGPRSAGRRRHRRPAPAGQRRRPAVPRHRPARPSPRPGRRGAPAARRAPPGGGTGP